MIKRVLDFLAGRAAPEPNKSADEFQLAVAALLIEAAQMDETFDAGERETIGRLLGEKFNLSSAEVATLVAQAEKAVGGATQLFRFTHQINKSMPPEKRAEIIEMLWEVAYSDGILDPLEDMLLRRVAGLIHVTDRDRGLARQRALEKLKAAKLSRGGYSKLLRGPAHAKKGKTPASGRGPTKPIELVLSRASSWWRLTCRAPW